MNKKHWKHKALALCLSVLCVTSPLTAIAADGYSIEEDIWSFCNNSDAFGTGYVFTEEDGAAFRENLSNVERRLAHELIAGQFLGSCYGMAVLSILADEGLIDYGAYTENAASLYEIAGDPPSEEIQSLINYYSTLQFTEEVRQYAAYSMMEQTEAERLQELIRNAEAGLPSLVAYVNANEETGISYGHAVTAYAVEYGAYEVPDANGAPEQYSTRIAVYNCNLSDQSNSYIYCNADGSWRTEDCGSADGGLLALAIADPALLNNKGLLSGTKPYVNDRDFTAMLSVNALLPDAQVQRIDFDNGTWTLLDSAEGQIMEFPMFLGEVSIHSNIWTLADAESGYVLTTTGIGTMSVQMNYQDCLLMADVNAGDQVVFDPSGYIAMDGEGTNFRFEAAFNEGHYSGSWYDLTVEGAASHASLMQTEEGYVLESDQLEGLLVTANNGTDVSGRWILPDFPLEKILIFETETGAIGFAADRDSNGSYETILHDKVSGDALPDGVLNILDVVLLQKWLLQLPDAAIKYWEDADYTHDGQLDGFDLALMKRDLLTMENAVPPPFDEENDGFHTGLGIVSDTSYDNVTATSLEAVYPADAEVLSCDLKNANLGKGFYFFPLPFLEKYENGAWERLYYGTPEIRYLYGDGYHLCGMADNVTDVAFSTRVKLHTKYLTSPLTAGRYRFVIYTAKNVLYAEFEVE